MPNFRSDQFDISVTVDGTPVDGGWNTMAGFDANSGDLKAREPDGKHVALGGPQSIDDGTVARNYDPARDDFHGWTAKRGAASIQIKARARDAARNPYGPPIVYDGILQSVTLSDIDRDGDEVRMVTLGVSANADVG